jgi:hypothetical protein
MDPVRDMDELLNIEGDPEEVLGALLAIEPCEPIAEPESGDEAITRLLDS